MAEVVWTEAALKHEREILEYTLEHAPARAEPLMQQIHGAVQLLETTPRMGRVVPEYGLKHLREVIVRPYRVVYRIEGKVCSIVAIIHGQRDFKKAFEADHG